jgi:pimeloyl-ACP methyl ester carboxylesterase
MPMLADRFDVLAVALLGHEDSGDLPPGATMSVQSLTDAVERDMDAVGFQTADIVGNSLGGWIALELAKRGRARSVVAFSPGGGWTAGSRAEKRIVSFLRQGHAVNRWAAPRARAMMRRSVFRRLMYMRAMAHPERLHPEIAADAIRAFAHARIPELIDRTDGGIQDLDRVKCPVLIAWPEKDRILPYKSYSGLFLHEMPHAKAVTLHDVGHVPMWDDPGLVADTISRFIAEQAPEGPRRFQSGHDGMSMTRERLEP